MRRKAGDETELPGPADRRHPSGVAIVSTPAKIDHEAPTSRLDKPFAMLVFLTRSSIYLNGRFVDLKRADALLEPGKIRSCLHSPRRSVR